MHSSSHNIWLKFKNRKKSNWRVLQIPPKYHTALRYYARIFNSYYIMFLIPNETTKKQFENLVNFSVFNPIFIFCLVKYQRLKIKRFFLLIQKIHRGAFCSSHCVRGKKSMIYLCFFLCKSTRQSISCSLCVPEWKREISAWHYTATDFTTGDKKHTFQYFFWFLFTHFYSAKLLWRNNSIGKYMESTS